jgi:hypothetical protein
MGGVAPKVFILFIYWVLQATTLIGHHTKIIEKLNMSKIESWWNFPFARLYKFDIQNFKYLL